MGYRSFLDPENRRWEVWLVIPTAAERRKEERRDAKSATLHFGKLLMFDAEMQVVDLRPTGFFNFDLDKYKDQLVAGYERTLPDLGPEVYMLGLDKLSTGKATMAELPK
ncbi:MAG: hypothetical protein NVSMB53_18500 [Gemmatimonadaceae bacterium]